MATGLSNKLASQTGEYLVCAELGRRGLIATTFTGNVPEYDLLVCDDSLRTLPVQVKTTRGDSWRSRADIWLELEIDEESGRQINNGPRIIDLDILLYGDITVNTPQLTIPHPRMLDRDFVMKPLSEIEPHLAEKMTRAHN